MNKLDTLKQVYAANLKKSVVEFPTEYLWPIGDLPVVLTRMYQSIDKMSFNKDSRAWKSTCKELNIKHTYQAIAEFIKE